jgi:hypothetical protein
VTTPDSFATSDDAAAYGYTLPGATAAGLLARATQALRDEAGIPITQTTSTLEVRARHGELHLPTYLITSITTVELAGPGGSTTVIADWARVRDRRILLGRSLTWQQRHEALYLVTYVHGFAVIPASLKMLTASVAKRLSVTPEAAEALKSKTVGSVSWTAGDSPSSSLSAAECAKLGRIVPVRRVWQVRI